MAEDIRRLLQQIQGWAASLEANWDTTVQWMDDMQNGHPRAQDFEPTGHGGSDPTAVNGILPDTAALDRKGIESDIRGSWRFMDSANARAGRYRNGTRPERKETDVQDVWCVLHLQLDAHEPRYRNDLCRPCAERKYATGDFPSLDDVRHHIKTGRWPRQRIDPKAPPMRQTVPKSEHVARLERLQLGTEALPDPTEGAA